MEMGSNFDRMRRLFIQLLILQVSMIHTKPVADTDTASSEIGDLASGLEGSSGISPSISNYMPSSDSTQYQQTENFAAANEAPSTGNDVTLKDNSNANQVNENKEPSIKGDASVASGETGVYASNAESESQESGNSIENMHFPERNLGSGQRSEVSYAAESGEKDFKIYTERQVDEPAQHANPLGTNAFEELQDTRRSPQVPFDAMTDSVGYKRDVALDDMMATPEYALLRPDQAVDENELAEFEELTDSLSYN